MNLFFKNGRVKWMKCVFYFVAVSLIVFMILIVLLIPWAEDGYLIHSRGELPVASDGSTNADLTRFGPAEMSQLYHYWSEASHPGKVSDLSGSSSSDYTRYHSEISQRNFVIKMTRLHSNPDVLTFVINEYLRTDNADFRNVTSRGGSCFRIQAVGGECLTCTVRDFLNGTYVAQCPKIYTCVDITVHLDYIRFEAYRHHADANTAWPGRIQKILKIYNGVCPISLTEMKNLQVKYSGYLTDYLRGRWWKTNGTWRWGSEKGSLLPYLTPTEIYRCKNDKISFAFIGDSHVRGISAYFMHLVKLENDFHLRKVHGRSIQMENIAFLWGSYPDVAAKCLRKFLSSKSTWSKRDVIVLGLGQWDLAFKSTWEFISNSSKYLFDAIQEVRQNPDTSDVRLVYFNIVTGGHGKNDSNYYMKAATNEILGRKMMKYGVEVFDAFYITNPLFNTTCDNIHYLCAIQRDGKIKYIGDTGITIAHLLLRQICMTEP